MSKSYRILTAETVSGNSHEGTIYKAAINAIDHLRAARIFDDSIKELKALVMPCNSIASCVSTVTVRWEKLRFKVSAVHHSLESASQAIKSALSFNYRALRPLLTDPAWVNKTPAELSHDLVILSGEDLADMELSETACQKSSASSIVIHDPDNSRFLKFIVNKAQANLVSQISDKYVTFVIVSYCFALLNLIDHVFSCQTGPVWGTSTVGQQQNAKYKT